MMPRDGGGAGEREEIKCCRLVLCVQDKLHTKYVCVSYPLISYYTEIK